MDWQTAFTLAASAASGALGLWVAALRDDLITMKADHKALLTAVSTLREHIPMHYATIDDLNRSVDQFNARVSDVFAVVSSIDAKLDRLRERNHG